VSGKKYEEFIISDGLPIKSLVSRPSQKDQERDFHFPLFLIPFFLALVTVNPALQDVSLIVTAKPPRIPFRTSRFPFFFPMVAHPQIVPNLDETNSIVFLIRVFDVD